MAKATRSIKTVVSYYAKWQRAGEDFTGACLKLARSAVGAPGSQVDPKTGRASAAYNWTLTKVRGKGTDFESTPDGAFLWYTGGAHGDGHVCFRYGRNEKGKALVYTNGDWNDASDSHGKIRHVQLLATMEKHYGNLHRAGWSYDCDGYTTKEHA